jgi:hypothetical protein
MALASPRPGPFFHILLTLGTLSYGATAITAEAPDDATMDSLCGGCCCHVVGVLRLTESLGRRIQRRMGLRQVTSTADYVELLRTEREEVQNLFRDLLIGVTAFSASPTPGGAEQGGNRPTGARQGSRRGDPGVGGGLRHRRIRRSPSSISSPAAT